MEEGGPTGNFPRTSPENRKQQRVLELQVSLVAWSINLLSKASSWNKKVVGDTDLRTGGYDR